MDSNVQPNSWKRYLKISAWLGYQPEATFETNLQQGYKTLYTRYCQDNGLHLNSDIDMQKHYLSQQHQFDQQHFQTIKQKLLFIFCIFLCYLMLRN
jgi:hypothetical protein